MVTDSFKLKVQTMTDHDKECLLAFDEMTLRSAVSYDPRRDCLEGLEDLGENFSRNKCLATHALAFMVRGLHSKWKQPLGYFVTGSTMKAEILKDLVLQAVDKCIEVGLKPCIVLCDQGANNRSCFIKHLGVTVTKPFFTHNDREVFVYWDTPHLIKNIRNNLKANGFTVDGHQISWDHIRAFYEQDCKLERRIAPKLTQKHLDVPGFSAMRVRLATQVLSHSVATGLDLFANIGALPKEALHTATFCENFDFLFNALNSMNLKSSKPYAHAITEDSSHWAFFEKMLPYLRSIKPVNRASLPSIEGWIHNIGVLKMIFPKLGFSFLLTNRLNQDCLENMFCQIRSKCGSADNPDTKLFRAAIRDYMVDQLLLSSTSSNCQEDVDSFLFSLNSLTDTSKSTTPENHAAMVVAAESLPDSTPIVVFTEHDYSHVIPTDTLSIQNENIEVYISGYIVKKLLKTVCESCTKIITTTDLDEQKLQFIRLKNYAMPDNQKGLCIPAACVVNLVSKADKFYCQCIDEILHMNKLRSRLYLGLIKHCHLENLPTCCLLGEKIISLYLNIRLYHSIRLANEGFNRTRKCRNRKLLKLSHQ